MEEGGEKEGGKPPFSPALPSSTGAKRKGGGKERGDAKRELYEKSSAGPRSNFPLSNPPSKEEEKKKGPCVHLKSRRREVKASGKKGGKKKLPIIAPHPSSRCEGKKEKGGPPPKLPLKGKGKGKVLF